MDENLQRGQLESMTSNLSPIRSTTDSHSNRRPRFDDSSSRDQKSRPFSRPMDESAIPFSPRQMRFFETEPRSSRETINKSIEEAERRLSPDALEILPDDTKEERRMKQAGSLLLNHIKSRKCQRKKIKSKMETQDVETDDPQPADGKLTRSKEERTPSPLSQSLLEYLSEEPSPGYAERFQKNLNRMTNEQRLRFVGTWEKHLTKVGNRKRAQGRINLLKNEVTRHKKWELFLFQSTGDNNKYQENQQGYDELVQSSQQYLINVSKFF